MAAVVKTGCHRKPAGRPGFSVMLSMVTALPVGLSTKAIQADTVVYRNDFETKPGSSFPEWSSSRITYASRTRPPRSGTLEPQDVTNAVSPNGKRRFLGEFGGPRVDPTARTRVRQTVRLQLKDLPRHSAAAVSFDLLVLKSWDGNSPQYGPDRWSLRVEGGQTLIDTTFSNNPKLQSDRSDQDYPGRGSLPQTGASAVKSLGYGFFGDSVYHLRFRFPHTADSLTLEFASDLFEGKGTEDEAWGLDNVRVEVTSGQASGSIPPSEARQPASGASRKPGA
jgi:hypothetical protein